MPVIDAKVIRGHLQGKTTFELCEDFEHLSKSVRPMPWAEQAISDVLFERDSVAWLQWQLDGDYFGRSMPHRFFGLV
jgi:alpha-D-ribose 1-methylphosphonate 5-triphosphate synthase subunit PhnH